MECRRVDALPKVFLTIACALSPIVVGLSTIWFCLMFVAVRANVAHYLTPTRLGVPVFACGTILWWFSGGARDYCGGVHEGSSGYHLFVLAGPGRSTAISL